MGIFFVLIVKRYNNLKYGGKLQTHYGTTWYPGSINPRAWSLGVKKKLENVYFNYYTRVKEHKQDFIQIFRFGLVFHRKMFERVLKYSFGV